MCLPSLTSASAWQLRFPLRVIEALLADPGAPRALAAWATVAGASGRNRARLLVAETGLTFGAWRQRFTLHEAVRRLDAGQPLTDIAFDLGDQSRSAFIVMSRKALGAPPGRYARRHGGTTG